MTAPTSDQFPASARLFGPQVRLYGDVSDDMYRSFREQMDAAGDEVDITLELTTLGGEADVARRICEDLRIAREHEGKTLWFAGRATVYSAGAAIMGAFPRDRRWLSRNCVVMIHERKMSKDVKLDSAMQASEQQVRQLIAEIEMALTLEEGSFRALAEGSDVGFEEMKERARCNWYITAEEALRRRLVAGLF